MKTKNNKIFYLKIPVTQNNIVILCVCVCVWGYRTRKSLIAGTTPAQADKLLYMLDQIILIENVL